MKKAVRSRTLTLACAWALLGTACMVEATDAEGEGAIEEQPWERIGDVGPGDVVVVDGVELVAPEPGVGVSTEIIRDDGTTTLVRIETSQEGEVVRFFDGTEVHDVDPPEGYLHAGRAECRAGAYSTLGFKWTKKLRWRINYGSKPSYLSRDAITGALRKAVNNITQQANQCGLPDQVGATGQFMGSTSRRTGISSAGRCVANDGVSVADFGKLPSGTLAVACTYYSNGRALAGDVKFNKAYRWYTGSQPPRGCSGRWSLRAVATHERGHTYGLGHVSESKYPYLTMSTAIGPCSNSASSLGWGDIRGLRRLY